MAETMRRALYLLVLLESTAVICNAFVIPLNCAKTNGLDEWRRPKTRQNFPLGNGRYRNGLSFVGRTTMAMAPSSYGNQPLANFTTSTAALVETTAQQPSRRRLVVVKRKRNVLRKADLKGAVAPPSPLTAPKNTRVEVTTSNENNREETKAQQDESQSIDTKKHDFSSSFWFPKLPPKIRAILRDDWDTLDQGANHGDETIDEVNDPVTRPRGVEMMKFLSLQTCTPEFGHARSTFYKHLQGTFGILSAWNQPQAVCRAGLVHTAYGGDVFSFYLFNEQDTAARERVKNVVGSQAEALIHMYGTIHRGELCNLKEVMKMASAPGQVGAKATHITGPQYVSLRLPDPRKPETLRPVLVSPRQAAYMLIITVADYIDQFVETNGWRDHHQVEDPEKLLANHRLYPGDGRPAIALYWMSEVCRVVAPQLESVPPIFDHCRKTLSYHDEVRARDLYWKVTLDESKLTDDEKDSLLLEAVQYNPFIAEPHVLLAQIAFRNQRFRDAAHHAKTALNKFITLATAWDKRMEYDQWVGFTRILLYRSVRKYREEHGAEVDQGDSFVRDERGLVPLQKVFAEMNQDEEDDHQDSRT
jgi:hypothetical protein